jgi:type I restriction enzyme R subunit
MASLSESVVEEAALDWLRELGYTVISGPEVPPGPGSLRESYADVVLAHVLRGALTRLNPGIPAEALDDAFRKLTRPEGPTLEARNRDVHRHLVDGVTIEYRHPDGRIAGAQARILDFDTPDRNDWLAINQFTVAKHKHTRRPTWCCSLTVCRW